MKKLSRFAVVLACVTCCAVGFAGCNKTPDVTPGNYYIEQWSIGTYTGMVPSRYENAVNWKDYFAGAGLTLTEDEAITLHTHIQSTWNNIRDHYYAFLSYPNVSYRRINNTSAIGSAYHVDQSTNKIVCESWTNDMYYINGEVIDKHASYTGIGYSFIYKISN